MPPGPTTLEHINFNFGESPILALFWTFYSRRRPTCLNDPKTRWLSRWIKDSSLLRSPSTNAPRRGERSEYGGIFRFRSWLLLAGGPNSFLGEIYTFFPRFQTVRLTFRDVLDYKFYIKRSIEKRWKKFFSTKRFFLMAKKPLFLAILGLTSLS